MTDTNKLRCPSCGSDDLWMLSGDPFCMACNKVVDIGIVHMRNELDALRADNERLTQENAALRELVADIDSGLANHWVTTDAGNRWLAKRDAILNEVSELQRLIACRDTHILYSPAWIKLTIKIIQLKRGAK